MKAIIGFLGPVVPFVFALILALVSAIVSALLLRVFRIDKPRFRFLFIVLVCAGIGGILIGAVVSRVVVPSEYPTPQSILWQFITTVFATLAIISLVVRTRAVGGKAWAAIILPSVIVFGIGWYVIAAPVFHFSMSLHRRIECSTNLRGISLSLRFYANDHEDKLPTSLETLFQPDYYLTPEIFLCPSAKAKRFPTPHYEYNPDARLTADYTLLWDKANNHEGGRNVCFGDFSVKWVTEEEFQNLLKRETSTLGKKEE